MLVKLRFLVSKCNLLRGSCVSIARNAGKVAISDFEVQPSAEIVRNAGKVAMVRAITRNAGKVAFVECGRGSTSTSGAAQIVMQRSWQRDLAQEIHIQRSCASGHTRSWCRDMRKRSAYRDVAQVVLLRRAWRRHLAQEILIHRSCTSPSTGFCWGDLKHLAHEILIQRSCASGPTTGSWCRHRDRKILRKRSADRDLAQVLQDPI